MTEEEQFEILLQKFLDLARGFPTDVVLAVAVEVAATVIVSDSSDDFDEAWDHASGTSRLVLERSVALWNAKRGAE